MTLPTAILTVKIEKITGIPAGALAGAQHAYALATIGGRIFGRSRPIPIDVTEFDLALEAITWEHELAAFDAPILVTLEIWDDRGDEAPVKLATSSGSLSAPYTSQAHLLGSSPAIACAVEVRLVPPINPTVPVPRAASGTTSHATLRLTDSIVVELTEVQGLFCPVNEGGSGIVRAQVIAGYTSQDDRGRVYLNQALDGTWTKDTQLIRLRAKLTAVRGAIPADAQVRWTVGEADDPTNDDPGFHKQWGRYVDENDYDVVGDHHGSTGGDNEGTPDRSPPWEADPAFPVVEIKNDREATTAVVGGESGVLLHCSNTAGDNFVVRAELVTSSKAEGFAAATGVITMWHRVNVAYFKMRSAFELPIADVPRLFEPACAQLDFVRKGVLPDQRFLALNDETSDAKAGEFVEHTFDNKKHPGWFCLFSVMEAYPPPPAVAGGLVHEGIVRLGTTSEPSLMHLVEFMDIPGTRVDADYVNITIGTEVVHFRVFLPLAIPGATPPMVRYRITPHGIQPDFVAGDGDSEEAVSISYRYSPRLRVKVVRSVVMDIESGGYGAPDDVHVELRTSGTAHVSAVSPTISTNRKDYFAGRTVLYSHGWRFVERRAHPPTRRVDFDQIALPIIQHELIHAFGMPHICGYFEYPTPRTVTCCMNYSEHWMVDDDRDLIPGTANRDTGTFCGRHLKEIRRTHLEDNKGLGWK